MRCIVFTTSSCLALFVFQSFAFPIYQLIQTCPVSHQTSDATSSDSGNHVVKIMQRRWVPFDGPYPAPDLILCPLLRCRLELHCSTSRARMDRHSISLQTLASSRGLSQPAHTSWKTGSGRPSRDAAPSRHTSNPLASVSESMAHTASGNLTAMSPDCVM